MRARFVSLADTLVHSVRVKFSDSKEGADESINRAVLASCVIQIANERNLEATRFRDRGDVVGAEKLLRDNVDYLEKNYKRLGDVELKRRSTLNSQQAGKLSDKDWNQNRKSMRQSQATDTLQQSHSGEGKKTPK